MSLRNNPAGGLNLLAKCSVLVIQVQIKYSTGRFIFRVANASIFGHAVGHKIPTRRYLNQDSFFR